MTGIDKKRLVRQREYIKQINKKFRKIKIPESAFVKQQTKPKSGIKLTQENKNTIKQNLRQMPEGPRLKFEPRPPIPKLSQAAKQKINEKISSKPDGPRPNIEKNTSNDITHSQRTQINEKFGDMPDNPVRIDNTDNDLTNARITENLKQNLPKGPAKHIPTKTEQMQEQYKKIKEHNEKMKKLTEENKSKRKPKKAKGKRFKFEPEQPAHDPISQQIINNINQIRANQRIQASNRRYFDNDAQNAALNRLESRHSEALRGQHIRQSHLTSDDIPNDDVYSAESILARATANITGHQDRPEMREQPRPATIPPLADTTYLVPISALHGQFGGSTTASGKKEKGKIKTKKSSK
jgi:hypothetical protein